VREIIENNQFEGATVGTFNANIIARKLGLSEKQDLKSETNIPVIQFVNTSKQFNDDGTPINN
jgi:hypothetical protein